jgi:hypothetical protein
MKHSKFLLAVLGTALIAACGPTQVVVVAEIASDDPSQGGEVRALGDLEIRLFPYDRDVVFDSLTAAATTPEPAIPDSVLDAQNQVAAAQQAWRDMEARWNTLRDTLQTLTDALDQLNRGQAQYRLLFRDFQDLEGEYLSVERQRDAAFENFTSLQSASMAAAEETRGLREQWADEAFAEVSVVMNGPVRTPVHGAVLERPHNGGPRRAPAGSTHARQRDGSTELVGLHETRLREAPGVLSGPWGFRIA